MSKAIFQILAGFTLAYDALLFFGGLFAMVRYPPHSYWDIVPGMAFVGALALAGLGLFYLRKWAALMVSALALYVASWGVKDALYPIPGYANWVGILFAVLLTIPAILTGTYWRTLVWRKKTNVQVS